jgi:hypothetical protein
MRAARTSIGIILTLSLLALPLGATGQSSDEAPAGDNEATEPVYVTWSGYAVDMDELSVPGEPETFPWGSREYIWMRARQSSEDPRISGDHTSVAVGEGGIPPATADRLGRFTSLVRIENDEGAWQGPVTDVFLPDSLWIQYGWLKGEGAYEGLSFFTSGEFAAGSPSHSGQGMIWPGDPPPVPDPALLEAE